MKKNFIFRPFLKILWSWMLTSLLRKSPFWPAGSALKEVKMGWPTKKSKFSKSTISIPRGGFAAGPLGLSVEVHVNFDKNLTMLVEKFWNASTGRLNRVNAAIDASNFYFNMLEIFQMYFTFPSFKNIATQRSFNEIIHFPLHCLKSTFSFQKSCRKSQKMIFGRSFQLSSKSIFSLQKSYSKSEKVILGVIFQFSAKFSKSIFSLQKSCRKY